MQPTEDFNNECVKMTHADGLNAIEAVLKYTEQQEEASSTHVRLLMSSRKTVINYKFFSKNITVLLLR